MAIETALAKGSQDNVSRRDPATQYHRIPRAQWFQMAPRPAFETYLKNTPAPPFADLNVVSPGYFTAVDGVPQLRPRVLFVAIRKEFLR